MRLFTQPRNLLDKALRGLLVFAIILLICAIAASLIVPGIHRGPDLKIRAALQDISTFETALDAFSTDVGRYPTTNEGLSALATNPNLPKWKGPYLKKIPIDPWGEKYVYQYISNQTPAYFLGSNGPDRHPNSDAAITNTPLP